MLFLILYAIKKKWVLDKTCPGVLFFTACYCEHEFMVMKINIMNQQTKNLWPINTGLYNTSTTNFLYSVMNVFTQHIQHKK